MAADEDMAIRFYDRGNPGHLADQLIAILSSPILERQMAEHNFAAGIEMTMTNVVNNYLRWFRVNRSMRSIRRGRSLPQESLSDIDFSPGSSSALHLVSQRADGAEEFRELEPATELADGADFGAEHFARRSRSGRNTRG